MLTRRHCMIGGFGLLLGQGCSMPSAPPLKLALLGQSLIGYDLSQRPYPSFAQLAQHLARNDFVFTDLEAALTGPGAGAPTRGDQFDHATGPEVLNTLTAMSVNLASLANNHAFDLGTGGILSTIHAVEARGIAHAGTGVDLEHAAAPAYSSRVALVAMASGKVGDGARATEMRPGVFEIRRDPDGAFHAQDEALALARIAEAAARADVVIACHHNHWWEEDWTRTPLWLEVFARRMIDAGATIFVGHGAPILQGIELHRGRPIFYDLGSFIFHSRTAIGYYPPESWQSVIVEVTIANNSIRDLHLVPLALNETGADPARSYETRGRPVMAEGGQAEAILDRLRRLSAVYGTEILLEHGTGRIKLKI